MVQCFTVSRFECKGMQFEHPYLTGEPSQRCKNITPINAAIKNK